MKFEYSRSKLMLSIGGLLVFLLFGCSDEMKNPLEGVWIIDRDKTLIALSEGLPSSAKIVNFYSRETRTDNIFDIVDTTLVVKVLGSNGELLNNMVTTYKIRAVGTNSKKMLFVTEDSELELHISGSSFYVELEVNEYKYKEFYKKM